MPLGGQGVQGERSKRDVLPTEKGVPFCVVIDGSYRRRCLTQMKMRGVKSLFSLPLFSPVHFFNMWRQRKRERERVAVLSDAVLSGQIVGTTP
jgi:hypothetical protein